MGDQQITMKDLMIQMAQQQQQLVNQQAAITALVKKLSDPPATTSTESLFDRLYKRMDKFVYDPDQEDSFDLWFRRYEDVFANNCASMDEKTKVRLLTSLLDAAAHARFCRHIMPKKPSELDEWDSTLNIFKSLFGTKKSLFRRRFDCLKMSFSPNDDIDGFINLVKARSAEANFKDIKTETMECLALVFAFQASELAEFRLRFLRKLDQDDKCTIDDLGKEYHMWKSARDDSKVLEAASRSAIHSVQKKPFSKTNHSLPRTPCPICHQGLHWKQDCPQKKTSGTRKESPPSSSYHNKPRIRYQKSINGKQGDVHQHLEVHINGRPSLLQLDTGADVTLISRPTWMNLGCPQLHPSADTLKTASGHPLTNYGSFHADFAVADVKGGSHTGSGVCYVTDDNDLLGMPWIKQLPPFEKALKMFHIHSVKTFNTSTLREQTIASLKTRFPSVFTPGLGRCTKATASLCLKPDALPVFIKKRPVPYASVPLIDKELDRLLEADVISPVDHSSWAAPIVVVKKANGTTRLCADFSTGLNDSLMLHQHPLPTAEDIFTKLNDGTIFSQIDFADAYLQIEVDPDSKELLTINTQRGLFRYNRLPFGVKSAPGIFQQIIDSMISGLSGVAAYLDDVIVTGHTPEQHNANLEALFQRIHTFGFRVRLDKCNFAMDQITYLGNVISATGRQPDPKKIDAITKMPPPKNIAKVRSFLGLINYYGSFVSEMRQLRAPLDALLKKDVSFCWTPECDAAFNRAKEALTSELLLTHFDPSLPIIVAADASNDGIGAVISHRFSDGSEKAIFHASRSLTAARKNYGQIEKEGLALIYAVRKFHRYLYGRSFTLLTDHKPLLAIFGSKKGIPVYNANRLQRWCLTLLAYNFKIEYRNTTAFGQADALSRLIASAAVPDEDHVIASISQEATVAFNGTVKSLPVSATEVEKFTSEDDCLNEVLGSEQSPPNGSAARFGGDCHPARGMRGRLPPCPHHSGEIAQPVTNANPH